MGPPVAVIVNEPVAVPPLPVKVTVPDDIVSVPSPPALFDDVAVGEGAGEEDAALGLLPGADVVAGVGPGVPVPPGVPVLPGVPVAGGWPDALALVATAEADGASPCPPAGA